MLIELTLILVYTCVLVIKTCDMSSLNHGNRNEHYEAFASAMCATYGFGSSATGLYLFFLFFGISMLSLQLLIAVLNLWLSGYVPRIFLLARAHGMSPWHIFRTISDRRIREVRRQVARKFRLDVKRLTPRN
eukprot:5049362-Prymnesium_polylepis.1